MYTWVDAAVPECAASDLIGASISFDYKQITTLQAQSLQFSGKHFNLVHFPKIESITHNVSDTQEWNGIMAWRALGVLRDTTRYFGNVGHGYDGPIRRRRRHIVGVDPVHCVGRTRKAAINSIFQYGSPHTSDFTLRLF